MENWLRACDFQRNEAGCNEHTYSEECAEHRALSVPRDCGCDCYVKIAVRRRAGGRAAHRAACGWGGDAKGTPPPSRTLDVSGRTLQRSRKVSGRGAFARMTLQFSIGNENGIAQSPTSFHHPGRFYLFILQPEPSLRTERGYAVAEIRLALTHSRIVS